MKYNIIYIQELIIDKIAGAISEDDDHILQHAIHTNPEAAKLWNEMHAILTSDKAKSFLDNIDEDTAWEKVKPQIDPVKSIQIKQAESIKWLSIAALLCITLSVIYYWQSKPVVNHPVVKLRKKNTIELQMANGQQIDLSDTTKSIINTPFFFKPAFSIFIYRDYKRSLFNRRSIF
jgi:transmembrane sensor